MTHDLHHPVPRMTPEAMNQLATPRAVEWLHAIEERPAAKQVFAAAPNRGAPPRRPAQSQAEPATA